MIGKNHNKMIMAAAKQKKSTSSASNKQPALPTDGGSKQPKQNKSTAAAAAAATAAAAEDEPEPPPPPLQPQPTQEEWAKPWVEAAHLRQTQMDRQQQAAFQHAQQFGAAYGAEHGSMEDQALMQQQQQIWPQQPWVCQGCQDARWGFYASCCVCSHRRVLTVGCEVGHKHHKDI